jgi:hypothetical protein
MIELNNPSPRPMIAPVTVQKVPRTNRAAKEEERRRSQYGRNDSGETAMIQLATRCIFKKLIPKGIVYSQKGYSQPISALRLNTQL